MESGMAMTEHQHLYVIVSSGLVSELVCECGVALRSYYNGAVVVEDSDEFYD